MKFYESSPTLDQEHDQFAIDIQEFKNKELEPVKFKGLRVAHGVYEQRDLDTYMIRIRCAAGGITPTQLKVASDLGEKYGSGEVHFTTRQEIQVHDVLIDGVMPVIKGLLAVGLSTRGGGGNTIRNILTPPDSGVNPSDVFDVDPYAIALTTRMVNEPDSWNLPRKFKINFSTNQDDVSYTQATCLGFVATKKDGQKGFEVYTSGGMGAKPMVGHQLLAFIPDYQVYQVTRALKIMFDKNGNRRSKYSSRIKFLWKKLGQDEFLKLFHEEFDKIKDDRSLDLELPVVENKEAEDISLDIETVSSKEFDQWKKRYVVEQQQKGLYLIKIPLQLGDLIRDDALVLCDFLSHFGDNTIRCDRAQNMRLRNIPERFLGNAFNVIINLKHTLVDRAAFIGNMINCTGAQTCKLGICLPRGLSKAIRECLADTALDLDAIPEFQLNMSGCPNTCGMHHIADLGFFGKVGRNEGNMYPSYNVLAGAERGAGKIKYAVRHGDIAAHHIPNFVRDFLTVYIDKKKKKTYKNYKVFLENEGIQLIKDLCEQYKVVPTVEEDESYYIDFGAKKRLSLDEIGTAECSAGLFDMLDLDKKMIKRIRKSFDDPDHPVENPEEEVYKVLFHASRMLLVTRGLDSKTDEQAFKLFDKHFVTTNLVDEKFSPLMDLGIKKDLPEIFKQKDTIYELADTVLELYDNMDDSLRFKTKTGEVIIEKKEVTSSSVMEKDYRGVACPMNFVKTKLVLETMKPGDQLKILLDDGAPIQNVPNSVKLEGHKVLLTKQIETYWEVLIEKG